MSNSNFWPAFMAATTTVVAGIIGGIAIHSLLEGRSNLPQNSDSQKDKDISLIGGNTDINPGLADNPVIPTKVDNTIKPEVKVTPAKKEINIVKNAQFFANIPKIPTENECRERFRELSSDTIRDIAGDRALKNRQVMLSLAELSCDGQSHLTEKFFTNVASHDFRDGIYRPFPHYSLKKMINYICSDADPDGRRLGNNVFPSDIQGDERKRKLWKGSFNMGRWKERLEGKTGDDLYDEIDEIIDEEEGKGMKQYWDGIHPDGNERIKIRTLLNSPDDVGRTINEEAGRRAYTEGNNIFIVHSDGNSYQFSKDEMKDYMEYVDCLGDLENVRVGNGHPYDTPGDWICVHKGYGFTNHYCDGDSITHDDKILFCGIVSKAFNEIRDAERNGDYEKANDIRAYFGELLYHHGHCDAVFKNNIYSLQARLTPLMFSSDANYDLIKDFKLKCYNDMLSKQEFLNEDEAMMKKPGMDIRWNQFLGLGLRNDESRDNRRALYNENNISEVENIVPVLSLNRFVDYVASLGGEKATEKAQYFRQKYPSVCADNAWEKKKIDLKTLSLCSGIPFNDLVGDIDNIVKNNDFAGDKEKETISDLYAGKEVEMEDAMYIAVNHMNEGYGNLDSLLNNQYPTIITKSLLDEGYFAK